MEKLLEIKNLNTYFFTDKGTAKAVRDLSITVEKGKTLALVGESGCGKSVTSLSVMQLIPSPPGKIVSGEILFKGKDLLKLTEKEMQKMRGNSLSMIFQEPMTSLNPVFTIGDQISEVYINHHRLGRKEALEKSVEILKTVGIPSPEKRVMDYPHQLSGGMRQRVMIAMALASPNPELLIADEPTTALDVTIQAQILDLMNSLQEQIGMSLLLITHDMGVVAEMADRVAVMYAGIKVEEAAVNELFKNPHHPYTVGLLNSIPANSKYKNAEKLEAIPGTVPGLFELGEGCPFCNRCEKKQEICETSLPEMKEYREGHFARCHFPFNGDV